MTLLHCCADAINKKVWVWEVGKIHKALLLSPLDFIISRKFITSKSYFVFWVVLGVVLGAPATGALRALLPGVVPGNSSWGDCQHRVEPNSCHITLPKMLTYSKAQNDCDTFGSAKMGSLWWLAQLLLSFSEANTDGIEGNRECWAARDIPCFLPGCAYYWAQIQVSGATC